MNEEQTARILIELRRIGVDFETLTQSLVGTGLRHRDMVDWLRAIPDGAGTPELLRRLDAHARAHAHPPVDYKVRTVPPRPEPNRRRERWWPTQELLDVGTDLLLEEWDPFGIRLAGTDRETIAMFTFHFFGPLLAPNGFIDPITHTAGMIASAERDHLALEPSPEPHRRYLAHRLEQLVKEYPVPPIAYTPPQAIVVVAGGDGSAPPPLDPEGVCTRCHAFGTVARLTTMTVPPRTARYCESCWAVVRAERHQQAEQQMKPPETAAEHITRLDRSHRPPTSGESRSWGDLLDNIRMISAAPRDADWGRDRDAFLAEIAREIVRLENRMNGPMPSEVEAFVRQYGGFHG